MGALFSNLSFLLSEKQFTSEIMSKFGYSAIISIICVLLSKGQITVKDITSKFRKYRAGTNESASFRTHASSLVQRNIVRIKHQKFGYCSLFLKLRPFVKRHLLLTKRQKFGNIVLGQMGALVFEPTLPPW